MKNDRREMLPSVGDCRKTPRGFSDKRLRPASRTPPEKMDFILFAPPGANSSETFSTGYDRREMLPPVFSYSRMPMVSHRCPRNRGTKKDTRSIQSANMDIQMPSTPKPQ